MNDGMVHELRWCCPLCGASDGTDCDHVRTRDAWWAFYACRACGAPVDPTNALGQRLSLPDVEAN
jgi:hypothetical protein